MTMINKRTKYLWFREIEMAGRKTRSVAITANLSGDHLGFLDYEPAWRQYVLESIYGAVWSIDCLREVEAVLMELNAERKHAQ